MDYTNDNPNKIKREKTVHMFQKETPIVWSDIKGLDLRDEDILHIGYDEGHYSENNSWDAHYFAIITRMVEETDEERDERVKTAKWHIEQLKQRRYENYLRLKKEFEGEHE